MGVSFCGPCEVKQGRRPTSTKMRTQVEVSGVLRRLTNSLFHPKDQYEGLLSDWLEEVPGVKRIVISEDFKINKKTCVMKGKDWEENISKQKSPGHKMNQADCFQYYNPTIKECTCSTNCWLVLFRLCYICFTSSCNLSRSQNTFWWHYWLVITYCYWNIKFSWSINKNRSI